MHLRGSLVEESISFVYFPFVLGCCVEGGGLLLRLLLKFCCERNYAECCECEEECVGDGRSPLHYTIEGKEERKKGKRAMPVKTRSSSWSRGRRLSFPPSPSFFSLPRRLPLFCFSFPIRYDPLKGFNSCLVFNHQQTTQ